MTEAEWLTCDSPDRMLAFIRGTADPRRLRLFQVACVRRVWGFVTDPDSRALVELVERAADGPLDEAAALALPYDWLTDDCSGQGHGERHAYMVAGHVGYSLLGPLHGLEFPCDDWRDAASAAEGSATVVAESARLPPEDEHLPAYQALQAAEGRVQAELIRCLFGNPFRPVAFSPRWRTEDAVGLARGIYAERAFERMPLLGDALMDAGCDSEAFLAHCRGPGPHSRGCWVVDGLLGQDQIPAAP